MRNLIFALALAGCATAEPSANQAQMATSPAPVIAAERAFAARAGVIGWIPAFCEYSAIDSHLIGQAGLGNAHERMCGLPDDGERNLFWAPVYAGIARSGDLGFTTGPASFDAERSPRIQYFTVWRKEADGSWKWIFDGGPGPVAEPGPYLAEGAEPATLATAASGVGSAATAAAQVNAIENGANASALVSRLAGDAHVYRQRQARAYGGGASATNMAFPTGEVSYHLVRTEASEAGDLVFTLGDASWTADGAARQGYFARMWQYRPEGWRIVYDQLVARAPPPAAN